MLNTSNSKTESGPKFEPPESDSLSDPEASVVGLHEALALAQRHLWLIGATILCGTVAAVIVAFSLAEVYTASSTLVFERKDAYLSEAAAQLEGTELNRAAIETEMDVIKSRLFVGRLVDSLGLLDDPFFNPDLLTEQTPSTVSSDEATTGKVGPTADTAPAPSAENARAISIFLSNLKVRRSSESLAMTIQVTHESPSQAAILTNAVAKSYVDHSLKRKKDLIGTAIVSLRERVTRLASYIAESEQKIADHIRDNQLDVNRRDNRRADLLRAEITQLRSRLQLLNAQQSENEQWATAAQVDQIETKLASMERELEKLTLADIRHRALEQELLTDRDRYNRLVEQLINLDSQADLQNPSARVVSPASMPLDPSFPRRNIIIVGGFLGSTILSFMLALLADGLVTSIRSDKRTMQIAKLPNLAYIPEMQGKLNGSQPKPYRYVKERPNSYFAETVRALFMACRRTDVDHPPKVIMLTSALPEEGKSTLAFSLAVTAANLGHRTVLVDLDLHRCGVSSALGIEHREIWLGSYLSGECDLADAVQADPEISGLDIIPAVTGSKSPSTLLNSSRLSEMITSLRDQYDVVILDTPAALIVNDASFLSALVDAAILVVRWGKTPEKALYDATERLHLNHIPVIGTAINCVKPEIHARYGYGGALAYYKDAHKYYSN